MTDTYDKLRALAAPFAASSDSAILPALVQYRRYYGLDFANVQHRLGTFEVGGQRIVVQSFQPSAPRATVLLIHGYLDHVGGWRHLIAALLEQGFSVATYDQPGHGLSDGKPASIDDFQRYVTVLKSFHVLCRRHISEPFHLFAHSMGAAVAMEYVLASPQPDFSQLIFAAPLLRSAHWHWSRFANSLLHPVIPALPRVFRRNSFDQNYLDFVRRDPLQTRKLPLDWFAALVRWERKMHNFTPSEHSLLVLQGDADTIVDWQYNLRFIQRRFPALETHLIAGAGHQLFNEIPPLRQQALTALLDYLTRSSR